MARRIGNLAIRLQPVVCADSLIEIKAKRAQLEALARQTKEIEETIKPMESEIIAPSKPVLGPSPEAP
jgi:triosephosphate isomerase